MIPTAKLRFVTHHVPDTILGDNVVRQVKILQQWWAVERAGQVTPEGEWIDVPEEKDAK